MHKVLAEINQFIHTIAHIYRYVDIELTQLFKVVK